MVWAILGPGYDGAVNELHEMHQSDRAVAIVGGALLDDGLRQTLISRFRPKDGKTDMNERLFNQTGPLGNCRPKIDLAYQLWILHKPERNTMHGISEIRNHFAHNLSINFCSGDGKITKAIDKLVMDEGLHFTHTHFWVEIQTTQLSQLTPAKINS